MRLARHEVTINAAASVVYQYLTEVEGLLQWMAIDAVADRVPGGELKWTHENGATMVGRFVELVPARWIIFTYGWEDGRMGLSPESTLVEIDLEERDGKTILRLVTEICHPMQLTTITTGGSSSWISCATHSGEGKRFVRDQFASKPNIARQTRAGRSARRTTSRRDRG